MINSYMRRLSTTGGTLKLKKGTYKIQVQFMYRPMLKLSVQMVLKSKKQKQQEQRK